MNRALSTLVLETEVIEDQDDCLNFHDLKLSLYDAHLNLVEEMELDTPSEQEGETTKVWLQGTTDLGISRLEELTPTHYGLLHRPTSSVIQMEET